MTDMEQEQAQGESGKVWICPGCGARYDQPTTCTAQHEPIEAVEYDVASDAAGSEVDSQHADEQQGDQQQGEQQAPTVESEADHVHVDVVKDALAHLEDAVSDFKARLGL